MECNREVPFLLGTLEDTFGERTREHSREEGEDVDVHGSMVTWLYGYAKRTQNTLSLAC